MSEDNEYMRAFVCVVPDARSGEALAAFADKLGSYPGYKWVAPENMHITLLFLRESDQSQIQRMSSNLERLGGVRPFDVKVAGAGAFPNLDAPKALWLGIREGAGELEKLAAHVAQAAKNSGYPPEKKKFKAHLTIARSRGDGGPMPEAVKKILLEAPELSWRCEGFVLMKSVLTPKGPIYTKIMEYPL